MDDQRTDRKSGGLMPRYSLKRFMVAISLTSAGLALFVIAGDADTPDVTSLPVASAICWPISFPMIGAGMFALFERAKLGAIIGFVLGVIWTILAYIAVMARGV